MIEHTNIYYNCKCYVDKNILAKYITLDRNTGMNLHSIVNNETLL